MAALFCYSIFLRVLDAKIFYFLILKTLFRISSIVQAKISDIPFAFLNFIKFVEFFSFFTLIFSIQVTSVIFIYFFCLLQPNLSSIMIFFYLFIIFIQRFYELVLDVTFLSILVFRLNLAFLLYFRINFFRFIMEKMFAKHLMILFDESFFFVLVYSLAITIILIDLLLLIFELLA